MHLNAVYCISTLKFHCKKVGAYNTANIPVDRNMKSQIIGANRLHQCAFYTGISDALFTNNNLKLKNNFKKTKRRIHSFNFNHYYLKILNI